jgi:hypothetical protein
VHRCIIPCIALYYGKGLLLPFLVEYFYKRDVDLTHLFCLKDANGSAQTVEHALFPVGMYMVDTFSGKKEVATCCSGLGVILLNYLSLTDIVDGLSESIMMLFRSI